MLKDKKTVHIDLTAYSDGAPFTKRTEELRAATERLYNFFSDIQNQAQFNNGELANLLAGLLYLVGLHYRDDSDSEEIARRVIPFLSWATRHGFGPVKGA